ncbi:unnamed protein product, partial [Mesorhabditis belari]|uniref:Putative hydroxypyruvate isomerase n=1 Tax=Mesorhabditis belari TaxID=2138241 RepID=A0AAF3E974_9BILA
MRVAANLNMLFTEVELLERYEKAAAAGFKAVEVSLPYGETAENLKKAAQKHSLQHVLINAPPGEASTGAKGLAAICEEREIFRESLEKAVKYSKILECSRIHVMAGLGDSKCPHAHDIYRENIRYACQRFEQDGLTCLIEPINSYTIPGYFLNSYDQALSIINEVSASNLKILFDVFHAQQICGQLSALIQRLNQNIGHIQIAQVPSRLSPDTPGEIDYNYLFSLLKNTVDDRFIGCEYKDGAKFDWVQRYGLKF